MDRRTIPFRNPENFDLNWWGYEIRSPTRKIDENARPFMTFWIFFVTFKSFIGNWAQFYSWVGGDFTAERVAQLQSILPSVSILLVTMYCQTRVRPWHRLRHMVWSPIKGNKSVFKSSTNVARLNPKLLPALFCILEHLHTGQFYWFLGLLYNGLTLV